ncbi:hypothetical protein GGF32_004211 [Allomyces javanicus]|nr:hypothetical protein GGF32_004211 [Allomyces javanicus]
MPPCPQGQAESSNVDGCASRTLCAVPITDDFLKKQFPQFAESSVIVEFPSLAHSADHPAPCVLGDDAAPPCEVFAGVDLNTFDVGSIGHAMSDPLAALTDWWFSYLLSLPPIDAVLLSAQVPTLDELELLLPRTVRDTGTDQCVSNSNTLVLEAPKNTELMEGEPQPKNVAANETDPGGEEAEETDNMGSDSGDGVSTPLELNDAVRTLPDGTHFVKARTRQNKLRYPYLPPEVRVPKHCKVPDPLSETERKSIKKRNQHDSATSRVRRAALMQFLDERCVALHAALERVAPDVAASFK